MKAEVLEEAVPSAHLKELMIRSGFQVLLFSCRQWQSFPWVPCASPAISLSQAGVSIKAPITSSAENRNAMRDP